MMTEISVVEQFRRLFRGREDAHGEFTELPDGDKRVKTVRSAPTPEMWENHLKGKGPFLGIIPVRADSTCYFGAIDVDNHGKNKDVNLVKLEEAIKKHRLPLIVCRSKSGGAHCYLFAKEPLSAKLLISRLKAWAKQLRLTWDYEIFPKQTKAEVGNWINLPYYGNDTNRYAVINGEKTTLSMFLAHAALNLVTVSQLEGDESEGTHPFPDGPPCLITLHNEGGYPEGTRNRGMYNVAIYMKIAGHDDWEDLVVGYNEQFCDPPMGNYELKSLIRSVREHEEYKYSCNDEPICSVCDKMACYKRRLGIGFWRQEDIDASMPNISNMVELKTDPPRYFIRIDGVNVEMAPEEFMIYTKFKLKCMIAIGRIPPTMRQHEWEDRANVYLTTREILEAPPDAGVFGQFQLLVWDFLTRRRQAENNPKELERGRPFERDGKVYFRSRDLFNFLTEQKFRDYTNAETFAALKKLGAGSHQFKISGHLYRAWFVPTPDDGHNDPLDVPRKTDDPNRSF